MDRPVDEELRNAVRQAVHEYGPVAVLAALEEVARELRGDAIADAAIETECACDYIIEAAERVDEALTHMEYALGIREPDMPEQDREICEPFDE